MVPLILLNSSHRSNKKKLFYLFFWFWSWINVTFSDNWIQRVNKAFDNTFLQAPVQLERMPGTVGKVPGTMLLLRACVIIYRIRPSILFKELAEKERNITLLYHSFHKWAPTMCQTPFWVQITTVSLCKRCTEQLIPIKCDECLEREIMGRWRRPK